MPQIVECLSCEGFGWYDDDFSAQAVSCEWCDGSGYVYQAADGVQSRIPDEDYPAIADQLEALEQQRMRRMGYTGEAKPPWEQHVRRGTKGGTKPAPPADDSDV